MEILLQKLFGGRKSIVYIKPTSLGVIVNGTTALKEPDLRKLFAGLDCESLLIPINCNGIHWCSIMVRPATSELFYYDPMSSSFGEQAKKFSERIQPLLKFSGPTRARVRPFVSSLGVQVDSYNCGLFVMVAFERFCGAESPGIQSKRLLQYLRYRYLDMCM
eukprot:jgi/Phyca11/125911/e_gw1.60.94.1